MGRGVEGIIEQFLEPPENPLPKKTGTPADDKVHPMKSTLYLLRREIKETGFGVKGRTPDEAALRGTDVKHRLFATTMLIFAGIDLLAKFVYGDERRKVEKRFKAFGRNYMGLSRNHAKRLWMVRNAMMHSFGLYTGDGCHVMFTESRRKVVVETLGRQSYLLSLSSLYDSFLDAIARYEEAVRSKKSLKKRFGEMETKYGFLWVGLT